MNDDELKNDAIDAQIQQGISRLRGESLHGMNGSEGPSEPEGEGDNDADEITKKMMAEDDAAEAEKKKGGGGIMGMVSGLIGG